MHLGERVRHDPKIGLYGHLGVLWLDIHTQVTFRSYLALFKSPGTIKLNQLNAFGRGVSGHKSRSLWPLLEFYGYVFKLCQDIEGCETRTIRFDH